MRLPISINTNLPSILQFPNYGWLLVKFSLTKGEYLTLTPWLGVTPVNIGIIFTSPEIWATVSVREGR